MASNRVDVDYRILHERMYNAMDFYEFKLNLLVLSISHANYAIPSQSKYNPC